MGRRKVCLNMQIDVHIFHEYMTWHIFLEHVKFYIHVITWIWMYFKMTKTKIMAELKKKKNLCRIFLELVIFFSLNRKEKNI